MAPNLKETAVKRSRKVPMVEPSEHGTFPNALVVDLVMNSLTSEKLIRTYRLVSKTWNVSACAALRTKAPVTIDEDCPDRFYSFKELLKERKEQFPCFPSPFLKIKLVELSFTDWDILNLVQHWPSDLILTEVVLQQSLFDGSGPPANKPGVLRDILLSHCDSLTTLDCSWNDCQIPLKSLRKLRLPNLKKLSLSFEDNCEVDLLNFISSRSELDSLTLRFSNSVPASLSSLNLEDIPSLSLVIDHSNCLEENPLQSFLSIKFPNEVKSLRISPKDGTNSADVSRLVSKWSKTIQVLEIDNISIPLSFLPDCPQLKEIALLSDCPGYLDPKKFPSLKKVTLLKSPSLSRNNITHTGVEELVFVADRKNINVENYNDERKQQKLLSHTLTAVGDLFPNLKHFDCDIREAYSGLSLLALRVIQVNFRRLRSLQINGKDQSSLLKFHQWREYKMGKIVAN